MILIPLLLNLLANAQEADIRSLLEKTFTRDNTFCKFDGKKIQFQVRGDSKFTEQDTQAYGEHLFFYPGEEKAELIPLTKDFLHTFRLFLGKSQICSKSHGYEIGKEKLAILFLMENRPFRDKLSIVLLNSKGDKILETINTDHMTDKASYYSGGFIFNSFTERNESELGKVNIEGLEFIYQDREFSTWMSFTQKGQETLGSVTFQKFPWKKYFKNEKDFFEASGWDATNKTFKNHKVYVAVNHQMKKECVLILPRANKIGPTTSGWRCQGK